MNSILKGIIITVILPIALLGCGTTPASKYYLLSVEASGSPEGASPSLGVGPIEIPEYLNRNALIYSREGNRLHIANFERWAEPLDSSIGRVVGLNLASLLNTQNIQAYPWSDSERPEYGVEVTVINMDSNDQQARLIAEWHIYAPIDRKTIARKISSLSYDMPNGPVTAAEVAPAYSKLLLQLSEIIAATISEDITAASTGKSQ